MEDMTSAAVCYQQSMMMTGTGKQPELPEQEQLKCPRCDSPNTKFCYYNNYNLSQPRHFCKNCRRYWTKGGSLRNIPVGGGSRKNSKRSGSSSSSSPSGGLKIKTPSASDPVPDHRSSESDSRDFGSGSGSGSKSEGEERVTGNSGQEMDPTRMLYGLPVGNGTFSSLLASNMQMGGIGFDETGSRWYPGMGMGSGFRRSEDAWTDLAMNRVEKN